MSDTKNAESLAIERIQKYQMASINNFDFLCSLCGMKDNKIKDNEHSSHHECKRCGNLIMTIHNH